MQKIDDFLEKVRDKTIHIIGVAGAEGSTVVEFLLKHDIRTIIAHDYSDRGMFQGQFFQFHDWLSHEQKQEKYDRIMASGISIYHADRYLHDIHDQDIIFVPQSWFRYPVNEPLNHFFEHDHSPRPEFQHNIYSLTQLYLQLFPGTTMGVTGSNGKSTTTALIAHMLQHIFKKGPKRKIYWGGNDRKNSQPLLDLDKALPEDILLLEISNRQLTTRFGISPNVAVITNIIPNHIDDHGSFPQYIDVKRELVRYQQKSDWVVLNYDDPVARESAQHSPAKPFYFSLERPVVQGAFLHENTIMFRQDDTETKIMPTSFVKLRGDHNIANVMAAITACAYFHVSPPLLQDAVTSFRGLDYRLEYVDDINGVAYYNDSAGCNPKNIPAAIQAFDTPLVVLAGGSRQAPLPGEFDEFATLALDAKVKKVILMGSIRPVIQTALLKAGVSADKIYMAETLKNATNYAIAVAVPGDTVVLAPGCESFGEFKDYRDRGQQFEECVAEMKAKEKELSDL